MQRTAGTAAETRDSTCTPCASVVASTPRTQPSIRPSRRASQFQRQGAGVDARELEQVVNAYVLPVSARTVAEARAPVESGGAVCDDFAVVGVSTSPVANPYLDTWRGDGDADRCARDYVGFRGLTESSLRLGLFSLAGGGVLQQAARH